VNCGFGIREIEQSNTYGNGEQLNLTSFGGTGHCAKLGWKEKALATRTVKMSKDLFIRNFPRIMSVKFTTSRGRHILNQVMAKSFNGG